jgi:mannose-6-phosphate isomerase-like protein (cupin superfamily)
MLKAGDTLDFGPLGMRFHIKETAVETDGEALVMEWELAPETGGTPVHVHPHASESYEVLEGELDVCVDGTWRTLTVGESATVEPGVPHTFRNASGFVTRVHNVHAPAMEFGAYFKGLSELTSRGVLSPDGVTLRGALYSSTLLTRHSDEIQLVQPPYAVMRVMSVLARLLGYHV